MLGFRVVHSIIAVVVYLLLFCSTNSSYVAFPPSYFTI